MERRGLDALPWRRLLWYVGITAAVYLSFRYVLPLVWPFVFALLVAGILRPVVRFLSRKCRVPVTVAGLLCVLLLIAALGGLVCWGGQLLLSQGMDFARTFEERIGTIEEGTRRICCAVEDTFSLEEGTVYLLVMENAKDFATHMEGRLLEGVSTHTWNLLRQSGKVLTAFLVFVIGAVLILQELLHREEKSGAKGKMRGTLAPLQPLKDKLALAGLAYVKAQGILILIISAILTAGLLLLKNRYALLIGIGIGVMDALPVLGSGLVLVPWAVIAFFFGSRMETLVLLGLFLLCQMTRELLEPRLLGSGIGVSPIWMLIAMYVGLKLFGVSGFLLGPIGLIVIRAVAGEAPAWVRN